MQVSDPISTCARLSIQTSWPTQLLSSILSRHGNFTRMLGFKTTFAPIRAPKSSAPSFHLDPEPGVHENFATTSQSNSLPREAPGKSFRGKFIQPHFISLRGFKRLQQNANGRNRTSGSCETLGEFRSVLWPVIYIIQLLKTFIHELLCQTRDIVQYCSAVLRSNI